MGNAYKNVGLRYFSWVKTKQPKKKKLNAQVDGTGLTLLMFLWLDYISDSY